MVIIKKTSNNNAGEDVEGKEYSFILLAKM
jgi:hypothetical protein